jgi:hypothetical protein
MGTALDITKTQKNPSRIWFGLAVPSASSYLILNADGSPDAISNPNRKLVGLTEKGAMLSLQRSFSEEFYDEVKYALERNLDQIGGSLKAEAAQVLDSDLLSLATVGMGTPLTPTGKSAWTLGESTLSFTSIAAIAPTKNDPTLFVVFHLYKAYNKADFDVALSRVERSKLPLDFVGVAIPTRASTDTFGCIYINTVAPTGP